MKYNQLRNPYSIGAFTMIEVTLALGVAGFCLLTLFGLLPVGLMSNQTSIDQTAAGNMAGAIVADLRQPLVSGSSSRFGLAIPNPGGTASMTGSTSPQSRFLTANGCPTQPGLSGTATAIFRATVGFVPPSTTTGRTATGVRVLISWPAYSDGNSTQSATWPVNYTGAFEADTTLDRN